MNAERGILLQHAAGFGVFIRIVNIFGSIVVLNDLVFHDPHAGFCNCQLCQGNPLVVCSHGCGQENPIHLFLRIGGKKLLGLAQRRHFRSKRLRRALIHDYDRFLYADLGSFFGSHFNSSDSKCK